MKHLEQPSLWFVCGSQHLYGPGPLEEVAANAKEVANALNDSDAISLEVTYKALLTTSAEIRTLVLEANADPSCAGLILWMHTFSPSRM